MASLNRVCVCVRTEGQDTVEAHGVSGREGETEFGPSVCTEHVLMEQELSMKVEANASKTKGAQNPDIAI